MELNNFQRMALETASYPKEYKTIFPALGLNGEAGEVAEKVKKVLRGDGGVIVKDGGGAVVFPEHTREAIALEIGDVMWYCATLAYDLGYSLEEIVDMNICKLSSRKERGKISGEGDYR